ncbi:phosphoenolpyruvate--protein phosphotransferase [Hominifimenecus sp. rT4P-3]|uniref:phosphoenolpyruvate--protein phosphotransferase n=1 Tax=Hominifimenecus sp. rT4P-3 TaxID=3242979 RepID=UPI003DA56367
MITLQGKGVSKGVERGRLYFFQRAGAAVEKKSVADIEKEKERVAKAQQKSVEQLEILAEKCREDAGDDAALLFETHAMFVEDEDYVDRMMEMMEKEQCNAEYAVFCAGEEMSAVMEASGDAYISERAADIRDVTRRLLNNLMGIEEGGMDVEEPVILAADDLAPSETLQMDKSKILGFITQKGSDNSHTAILARTMGIPAICAVGDKLTACYAGTEAFMDGETGEIILDADRETAERMEQKRRKQKEDRELLQALKGQEDVTLDGRHVKLYCNIGSPDDIDMVLANDGQGIGLFRSEFLYLASDHYPSEEEQFQAYKAVASAMGGKRVIIRTLDIGADKKVDYFQLEEEENPAMGLRAIRICLEREEIFRTQLRALYRASAYGKVAIMFPMITSVWEVEECRKLCDEVMAELLAEGIPFQKDTELGIMIETPAAVWMAEELAKLVDFFSVGTNDLTQYMLACDRQANHLERFFDAHHPAVLRALKMTADAAHKAGIWMGICGELAADLSLLPTFLAMGVDELSVSPALVLPLRAAIRSCRAETFSVTP